jgi:hypothetical protein
MLSHNMMHGDGLSTARLVYNNLVEEGWLFRGKLQLCRGGEIIIKNGDGAA